MKRLVPDEIRKVYGWLLQNKDYDDANFMSDIIRLAEAGQKIDGIRKVRLEMVLRRYQRYQLLEGFFK